MKKVFALSLLLVAGAASAGQCPPAASRKSAVVPTEAKAVAVARAAFLHAYDPDSLKRYEPFRAQLVGRVWHVSGTTPGGAPQAQLCQASGAVVRLQHAP